MIRKQRRLVLIDSSFAALAVALMLSAMRSFVNSPSGVMSSAREVKCKVSNKTPDVRWEPSP